MAGPTNTDKIVALQDATQSLDKTVCVLTQRVDTIDATGKSLGTEFDIERRRFDDHLLKLSKDIGELQQDVRNLRKEFDTAIARIDKSLDWTRELWKALALIVVTAVISTAIMGIKDYYLRSTPAVSNPASSSK